MTGQTLLLAARRMAALCTVTLTAPTEWSFRATDEGLVRATNGATGCVIFLVGGLPDEGAGALLSMGGLSPTAKRIRMFRAGGGALGLLLERELGTFRRRNAARNAERAAGRAEEET